MEKAALSLHDEAPLIREILQILSESWPIPECLEFPNIDELPKHLVRADFARTVQFMNDHGLISYDEIILEGHKGRPQLSRACMTRRGRHFHTIMTTI